MHKCEDLRQQEVFGDCRWFVHKHIEVIEVVSDDYGDLQYQHFKGFCILINIINFILKATQNSVFQKKW